MSDNLFTVAAASDSPRSLVRVRSRLRLKDYSIQTKVAYTVWIRRFSLKEPRTKASKFLTAAGHAGKACEAQALAGVMGPNLVSALIQRGASMAWVIHPCG